ncbi:hypothetical protein BH09SUM1_BH09SUM1_18080 [soil metagenome]
MNNKMLLQLGAELLFTFRHGDGPADRAVADYFRERKFLGSTDRKFISDTFFQVLRNLRRYDEAMQSSFANTLATQDSFSAGFPVTSSVGARAWERAEKKGEGKPPQLPADRVVDTIRLGLAAIETESETAATVGEELSRSWPELPFKRVMKPETLERMMTRAAEVAAAFRASEKAADQDRAWSFPMWLWAAIAEGRAPEELAELGEAIAQQAPFTLRVNTLRTTVEDAEAVLRAANLDFARGEIVDTALVFNERQPRLSVPNMDKGWFEVQDEGSQLVSLFAAPEAGQTVIDACAGGGGKSLHLAALMNNTGKIHAFDIEPRRLENLFRRAARTGVAIVDGSIKLGTNGELPSRAELADADLILIDAPCSGTGTLRRNPEVRWTLSRPRLEALKQIQRRLLDDWADRVKVGGRIVYATCSLLAEENTQQVARFLKDHPNFEIDAPDRFPVDLTERWELQLSPHIHGCDGFYAARLVRKS